MPMRLRWSAALLLVILGVACAPRTPRNLVLVSLDTTRPDHLSTYGYSRTTSPNLDRLANGAAVFRTALAQWNATGPSHASMLTGLYPHAHGVGLEYGALPPERPTLQEILEQAGFRTGAFVSGYTMRGRMAGGLERGFDIYESRFKGTRRDGMMTTDLALQWLENRDDGRFFLFLHLYDAHGPFGGYGRHRGLFRSAEPGRRLAFIPGYQRAIGERGEPLEHLNDYIDLYDEGLRYQDDIVGKLLDALDLDRTAVIVVADHGETLGERSEALNLNHSSSLFEEQIRIPFVVHSTGVPHATFDEIVETVDILPTALELLQIPLPEELEIQGESLVPLLRGARSQRRNSIGFSGTWARKAQTPGARALFQRPGMTLDQTRFVYTVRSQRWKLIVYPGTHADHVALFDLDEDPGERTNVAERFPEIRDRMLARGHAWAEAPLPLGDKPELSAEEIENLRALGYID